MRHLTTLILTSLWLLAGWTQSLADSRPAAYPDVAVGPKFTTSGELLLPQGFRKWVFIGSPLTGPKAP